MNEFNQQRILQMFVDSGVLVKGGHFVYASGKHGSVYVNKDAIYPHPLDVGILCSWIVEHFCLGKIGVDYDVVVGPEKGGIILAQWTAYNSVHIYTSKKILAVYAEKEGDGFVFRRGYDKLITGKKVLVVEDVLTTGSSVGKVIKAVQNLGGTVIGLGALFNRGDVTANDLGIPDLYSLVNKTLNSWDEAVCPLCKDGIPINTDFGKGSDYLKHKTTKTTQPE
jgi:orotate phosphoribosyltransferase